MSEQLPLPLRCALPPTANEFGSPADIATARAEVRLVTATGFVIGSRHEAAAIEAAYVKAQAAPFPGQVWEVLGGGRFLFNGANTYDLRLARLIYDSRIGRERV